LSPESERQLAREIYQEMIAVKSGYTTGSTTPVAEAVARRLRAAGFADADVFVGGASPAKANLVVRYRARAAASRCCRQQVARQAAEFSIAAAGTPKISGSFGML
jgi:hypothetical protein